MLGWPAQIAIQFFQEGVVFVSLFLSNFSAFIAEPVLNYSACMISSSWAIQPLAFRRPTN
jgi:hypothetical protein